jgi:hypothetical protein
MIGHKPPFALLSFFALTLHQWLMSKMPRVFAMPRLQRIQLFQKSLGIRCTKKDA